MKCYVEFNNTINLQEMFCNFTKVSLHLWHVAMVTIPVSKEHLLPWWFGRKWLYMPRCVFLAVSDTIACNIIVGICCNINIYACVEPTDKEHGSDIRNLGNNPRIKAINCNLRSLHSDIRYHMFMPQVVDKWSICSIYIATVANVKPTWKISILQIQIMKLFF